MPISLIVCTDNQNGIAKDGKIPWHYPMDMRYFKSITEKNINPFDAKSRNTLNSMNIVVMGRKTYNSLSNKYRPLPNRLNIVLTKNRKYKSHGAMVVHHLTDIFDYVDHNNIYIIGGKQIYEQCLELSIIDRIYLNTIDHDHKCDIQLNMSTYLSNFACTFSHEDIDQHAIRFGIYDKIMG